MSLEQHEHFLCPYCGRSNALSIDITGGSNQEFVTDCETCCRPIVVSLELDGEDVMSIEARKENE